MPDPDESRLVRGQTLTEQLVRIQEHLSTLDTAQRAAKRVQLGFAFLIVLAMLLFGNALYRQMRTFTAENVLPVVAERAVAFFPQMTDAMARVGGRVMPVYVEEFQKQAPRYMPLITHVAEQELSAFAVQLEADTYRHFSGLADRLARQEQTRLAQRMYALRDVERAEIFADNLYRVIHESLLMVLLEKFQEHLEPVHALQHTVDQYRRELAGRNETNVEVKLLATGLELMGKRLAEGIE